MPDGYPANYRRKIQIIQPCPTCQCRVLGLTWEFSPQTDKVVVEWQRDDFKADVAVFRKGALLCIFEITHSSKTKDAGKRPEPWFEVDADALLMDMRWMNGLACPSGQHLDLECLRERSLSQPKCEFCAVPSFLKDLPFHIRPKGIAKGTIRPCVTCGAKTYTPVAWPQGKARALCTGCIREGEMLMSYLPRLEDIIWRMKTQKWTKDLPSLRKSYAEGEGWRLEEPCIACNQGWYVPIWLHGWPRALCTDYVLYEETRVIRSGMLQRKHRKTRKDSPFFDE